MLALPVIIDIGEHSTVAIEQTDFAVSILLVTFKDKCFKYNIYLS